MTAKIRPLDHQVPLPRDCLILAQTPDEDAIPMDVVFVGGGPAGLAGAIELARLVKEDNEKEDGLGEIEIAVFEKAEELGQHNLSGAVVDPRAMRELFPGMKDKDFPFRQRVGKEKVYLLSAKGARKLPTPPTMKNHGNYMASICEMVRWLGEQAEGLGVQVFPGFPVEGLLVEKRRVVGVRTASKGLDREGNRGSKFEPAMDVTAKVVALAEGTRGPLSQAWMEWQGITSKNPQIFALGVKEVWETKKPLDHLIHTMGWPLPKDAFGGCFMYPMEPNLVAFGLVVGMDYQQSSLDVHVLLQRTKEHPLFRKYFANGVLNEWGAKTIPEGGYWSLGERWSGDHCVVLGDCAGFVDVPSLKGIHYAIQSGIYGARAIFKALKSGDASAATLSEYDRLVRGSYILEDLRRTRNMRLAFKSGLYTGGFKALVMSLTGGRLFGGYMEVKEDAAEEKEVVDPEPFKPDGRLTFSKLDSVFKSGNATRDTVPQHLIVKDEIPEEVGRMYAAMCPAHVYEWQDGRLVVNPPNCIDCKATDVIGPRWTPREGGSGPRYRRM